MAKHFTLVAHLVARPDKVEETKESLLSLVKPTRDEVGCVEYHLHQDDDHPAEFTFYENWKSRADWDGHMTLPHLQEFAKRIPDLFAVEPHMRKMTMISER